MGRPTGYPEWATSPTNIAEPSAAKKLSGWGVNEAPPSSYVNWLQSLTNKWIKYFEWEPVVDDDFVRGTGYNAFATMTFGPVWNISTGVHVGYNFVGGGPGAAVIQAVASGAVEYLTTMYNFYRLSPGPQDFQFEMLGYITPFGGSGSFTKIGFIDAAMVMTTGMSGGWYFTYTPSSAALTPTSIPFSSPLDAVDPVNPSYTTRLLIESEGATMSVYVNDVLKVSTPAVALKGTAAMGARTQYIGFFPTHLGINLNFDKITTRMRRR